VRASHFIATLPELPQRMSRKAISDDSADFTTTNGRLRPSLRRGQRLTAIGPHRPRLGRKAGSSTLPWSQNQFDFPHPIVAIA
jgi:hypothetical protein